MSAVLFVVHIMLLSGDVRYFDFCSLFGLVTDGQTGGAVRERPALLSLSLFGKGAGGEVRLSAIWIPSNCSSGFSLNPSPNLYFLSGRPIFHRLANNAVLPLSLFGEGVGG